MPQDISIPLTVTKYPDPTPEELQDPLFEAIWQVIKGWDLSEEQKDGENRGYMNAMGNHAAAILHAVQAAMCLPIGVLGDAAPSDGLHHQQDPVRNPMWFDEDGAQDDHLIETLEEADEKGEWLFVMWAKPDLQCYHMVHKLGVTMPEKEVLAAIRIWAEGELNK